MTDCMHTSDWHKRMMPCMICGLEHSDEEADRIRHQSTRVFTKEQEAIIERTKAEAEDDQSRGL